ncbi:DNA topoisomerase III [Sedimentibacter sp. zth1]|uniref:DNA topoisomerase III n=1 Tax=Sedimentibacter sp. zth1 TaxID=2816908 RepID=UPI001A914FB3|nr:DNA topoisomerase III [Sedimentibacter sp. zth1]QSX05431.1 DNA topoisomerase III [Sedimentibacter sp. zth1]
MKVVIAEKPSVARDIARTIGATKTKDGYIEGNNYIVTWCIGHLVGLAFPSSYNEKYKQWNIEDLPIIPEQFKFEVFKNTKKQFNIIKDLINSSNTTEVIFAADAGREGELINRLVYSQAKCTKPIKRLWISSMTEEAIKQGFKNLKDGKEYENLYKSAECRAIADWLIGINASRKYSIEYSKLTLGRVQTPTLAMIVQRQDEIDNFVSTPYYEIEAEYDTFTGKYVDENGKYKFTDEKAVENILNKTKGFNGIVKNLSKKQKKNYAPLPFDLTELQREANKRYGYTAQKTLNIAQTLYEKHKATTYPRTDSRYLSDDMISTFKGVLEAVKNNYHEQIIDTIKCYNKLKCINNLKISDHHAIIPTNKKVDINNMTEDEKNIYQMVCTRFVVQFLEPYQYEETILNIDIQKHIFVSKGKIVLAQGWKAIECDSKQIEEMTLPKLNKNDTVAVNKTYRVDKKTTPKKQFTEATLLTAMENAGQYVKDEELKEQLKEKGIGTPATRASIIEKIIKEQYIDRKRKNLVPTEKGINLITIAPTELTSAELTGEWEQKLNKIAKGEINTNTFLDEIKNLTKKIVETKATKQIEFKTKNHEKEVIGICPRCKRNIYEGKKNFYCEGYKEEPKCTFAIWKDNKFYGKVTKTQAKKLLKGEKVLFQKLKSKKGKEYEAFLKLEDTGKYVNLVFDSYNTLKKNSK